MTGHLWPIIAAVALVGCETSTDGDAPHEPAEVTTRCLTAAFEIFERALKTLHPLLLAALTMPGRFPACLPDGPYAARYVEFDGLNQAASQRVRPALPPHRHFVELLLD